MVDGLEVDRDTLEVRPRPQDTAAEEQRRYGPRGPGDIGSDYVPSAPAREWE
jgi:hypothetical protein